MYRAFRLVVLSSFIFANNNCDLFLANHSYCLQKQMKIEIQVEKLNSLPQVTMAPQWGGRACPTLVQERSCRGEKRGDCQATWRVGPWGECVGRHHSPTRTCGEWGNKTRQVRWWLTKRKLRSIELKFLQKNWVELGWNWVQLSDGKLFGSWTSFKPYYFVYYLTEKYKRNLVFWSDRKANWNFS